MQKSKSPLVLDPACGEGSLLLAARALLPRARLAGSDVDARALAKARAQLPSALLSESDALLAPPAPESADAVLMNPPYVAAYARGAVPLLASRREQLARRFPDLGPGEANGFLHFLELALELVRPGGRLGLVLPDTLLTNERYERARRALVARTTGLDVRVLDWPVFGSAGVRTALFLCSRRGTARSGGARVRVSVFDSLASLEASSPSSAQTSTARALEERPAFAFPRGATDHGLEARFRRGSRPLGSVCWVRDGINPGPREFRQRVLVAGERPPGEHVHPCLEGKDVARWTVAEPRLWVRADPALLSPELRKRGASFRESWIFDQEKLVSRQTSPTLVFAREPRGHRALNSAHMTGLLPDAGVRLEAILALLNSSPLAWYYARSSGETRRVFPQVHVSALRKLPLPAALWDRPGAEAELVRLARALEDAPGEASLEARVDALAGELFGLTRTERRLVARR